MYFLRKDLTIISISQLLLSECNKLSYSLSLCIQRCLFHECICSKDPVLNVESEQRPKTSNVKYLRFGLGLYYKRR